MAGSFESVRMGGSNRFLLGGGRLAGPWRRRTRSKARG
jgi:hypothetical protein